MVELETLTPSVYTATRPPTPPRDDINNTTPKSISRASGSAKRLLRKASTVTPKSSLEVTNSPTTSNKKRVVWADLAGHNDAPNHLVDGNQLFSSPVQITPSAERKAPKSILKSASYNDLSVVTSTTSLVTSYTKMLESTLQQLDGGDRATKVDAYVTLVAALKGTDNVPDVRALRGKMDKLVAFIKRDLIENEGSAPETSLAMNAVVLLCSFFHNTLIVEMISADFAVWIIDFSIRTFENPSASKDVVRYLMFILAKQSFPPQVMSKERVYKIINVLHALSNDNLVGKRIIDGRLNIYRTFLRQSKSYMLGNPAWLGDLMTDMTSKYKECRVAAITFGLEASFLLGYEPKITRAVSALFATEIEDKGKYGHLYIQRLYEMAQIDGEKDLTARSAIPQIWSVVVMFFRSRLQSLERWEFLMPWLNILSNAFNGSDIPARKEALLAWNRFIFVVHSNETSSPVSVPSSLAKLIPQALEGQLRRANMRTQALNTLCCLLFYSLKSSNTQEKLATCWNEYVARLVGKCLIPTDIKINPKKAQSSLSEASTILHGLFDIESKRNWNEQRILENQFPAHELNSLDPKWVRRNADVVFPLVGSLLEKQFWNLSEQSHINRLWHAYVSSISSPAIMEIKVSNDTMGSIAVIFGFLHKTWRLGPKSVEAIPHSQKITDSMAFLASFAVLIRTLLNRLGTLPFTDRQLCLGTQNDFTAIATPSQKPSKLRGEAGTPLYHLVVLLSSISPNLEYGDAFIILLEQVFEPFFATRKTKLAKIELARTLLDMLPSENTEPIRMIWDVVATLVTSIIDDREMISNSGHDQPLGANYKELVKILEFGITLTRNETASNWNALYKSVAKAAALDAGDSGKAIALIEPLTTSLLRKDSAITPLAKGLHFTEIVKSVAYPRDKHALDAATKKIWGIANLGQRSTTFDPYFRFYEYLQTSLEIAYSTFDPTWKYQYSGMLAATSSLIKKYPRQLSTGLLNNLQRGVGPWVQNTGLNFHSGDLVSKAVLSLWNAISAHISLIHNDIDHSSLLETLNGLLCYALDSKQKDVVNSAISLWNNTFGNSSQELKYPEKLQNILLRLNTVVEIQLPSLPASLLSHSVENRQPTEFEETQFDFGITLNVSDPSPASKERPVSSPFHKQPRLESRLLKRSREATPEGRESPTKKRATTPRLRHDDSQIQFQAIDSSPIMDKVVDSQLLTDRQREVRERQLADGMFQNLGSSPRRRRESANESDQELPVSRSSTKSSLLHVRPRERQTTPVLVTPSEDFDEFIASSPTPTRSIKSGAEDDVPGSSPPQPPVIDMDLDEVPSSPIEYLETQDMENDISNNSAQLDPLVEERTPVIVSTYGTTLDLDGVIGPLDVEEAVEAEVTGSAAIADIEKREASLAIPVVFDETTLSESDELGEISRPSMPAQNQKEIEPGSPASSDVFVDAVSSPPSRSENATTPASFDSTDFDESSIIRALAEAEEMHTTPKRPARASILRDTSFSPSKFTPQVIISRTTSKLLEEIGETPAPRKTRGHRPPISLTTPFHIPETPAHGPTSVALSQEIFDSDPSLTPQNTIVFSNPALWEDEVVTRSAGKFKTVEPISVSGQKRKFVEDDEEELANSQQSLREGSLQSTASTSKRGRGRPRKSEGEEADDSQEFQLRPSSQTSNTSAKRSRGRPKKILRPSQELDDDVAGLGRVDGQNLDKAQPSPQAVVDVPEIPNTSSIIPSNQLPDMEGKITFSEDEILNTPDSIGMVPETVHKDNNHAPIMSSEETEDIFETSREDVTASAIEESNADIDMSSVEMIEETRIEIPEVPTPATPKSSFSIIGTLRDQLQALMNTLRGGSLTRTETNEVEDGLWDVKEALCGAAKRGRNQQTEE